jgi:hypothetical protein
LKFQYNKKKCKEIVPNVHKNLLSLVVRSNAEPQFQWQWIFIGANLGRTTIGSHSISSYHVSSFCVLSCFYRNVLHFKNFCRVFLFQESIYFFLILTKGTYVNTKCEYEKISLYLTCGNSHAWWSCFNMIHGTQFSPTSFENTLVLFCM